MVRWYHAIFTAYGFWLPNDPRGSWSDFVYSWELFRFGGPATKVSAKRSHAHDPHDADMRRQAKLLLKYPPARFDRACRESIGSGFALACDEFGFRIYSCAIGFDHVHLVASRDAVRDIENVVAVLKARATSQMKRDGTHPLSGFEPPPTPWAKGLWSVFINDVPQLHNAIAYVEHHPQKEGLPAQAWNFVHRLPGV
jgi:REP element-mobilizing transposase RayT